MKKFISLGVFAAVAVVMAVVACKKDKEKKALTLEEAIKKFCACDKTDTNCML